MNFVSHMVVAQQATPEATTPLLLGAAAPDLARMARLPVATAGPPGFTAGVATHHRTDAVFHGLDWFRATNRRLVRGLSDRGVRRGPARGAAHVLIELLLDGAVLARAEHAATFARPWAALAEPDDDALAMVADEDRSQWVEFLGLLTDRLEPVSYGDPRYAADRTAGTLARRPRLAMNNDERAVLRGLADDVHEPITRDADDVLRSVVAAVL
ncbi:MAG TPA: hypothetical protein VFP02_06405 [Acidimicrobiales bacterium]|nr:hypothetical protein [Acidimicrobiales bacterium]